MIDEAWLKNIEDRAKRLLEDMEAICWGKPRADAAYDPKIGMYDDLYAPREREMHAVLSAISELAAAYRKVFADAWSFSAELTAKDWEIDRLKARMEGR